MILKHLGEGNEVMSDTLSDLISDIQKALRCSSCPYDGICCRFGTSLSVKEAERIIRDFGPEAVTYTDDQDDPVRTSTPLGSCFALRNGRCVLHDRSYYPEVCRTFPDLDLWDPDQLEICPFLTGISQRISAG